MTNQTLVRTEVRKEDKMRRNLMALAGVAALVAALAGPAVAQEKTDWVWHTDGKRYWRTEEIVKPMEMPKTQLVQVAEKEEGAIQGFKYVGKRMETAYFKEVPVAAEVAKQGHECSWRMVYEKKQVNKYNFCIVNGAEQPCAGMNAAGECVGKK
jgi:hypothetical protein